MAKKKHILTRDFEAMLDRLKSEQPSRMSEAQKVVTLKMLREGTTLTAIARLSGMAPIDVVYNECKHDPTFAEDLREARAVQATARIDRAQDMLDDAAETNDTDRMRGAAVYTEQALKYAEKIAPKEYGALVKHAGVDGGAIQLTVVNYADGSSQKQIQTSRKVEAED